jgi:uncharacterized membrane protein
MRFAYSLPLWAWLLGFALIVAVAVGAYRHTRGVLPPSRRAVLVALRVVTLTAIAVILMRPVSLEPAPAASGRAVAVVIDDSRSMRLRAADGAETRLDEARQLVEGRLRPALAGDFEVRLYGYAGSLRDLTDTEVLSGDGAASDLPSLPDRLRERAASGDVVAAVLISDGATTTPLPPGAPDDDEGTALPIFTVGVGEAGAVADREVRDVVVSDVSVVDSLADVAATVVSHGGRPETVDVRLLENGRPIDVRQVPLPGHSAQVREIFRVAPSRTAATVYTVEVAPGPNELTLDNNSGAVFVPVPGEPHPVLVLQGGPGFEHGFLTRVLGLDPGLDVDGVVTKGRTPDDQPTFYVQGNAARTPYLLDGFPSDASRLFAYDVVVLGNMEADQLTRTQLDLLRAFVERRGGGLAVIGARSFGDRGVVTTPLGDTIPVEPRGGGAANAAAGAVGRDGVRITLTDAGRAHPLMQVGLDEAATEARWGELPSLAAASAVGPARPGAEVLATVAGPAGDPQPLVAVQRVGRGRTFAFMGEGAWRWRMGLPSDDRTYETFWRQAVRWLAVQAPGRVHLEVGPLDTGTGAPLVVRVVDEEYEPVADAGVTVRVREPGGTTRSIAAVPDAREPGTYRATFLPAGDGVHTFEAEATAAGRTLGRHEIARLAGGADPELVDPRRNDAVLQRLAEATGGALLQGRAIDEVGQRIRDAVATPVARTVQRDLWHNPWTFMLIVALLGLEWALRRRWGLR